jgi:hypothetical protein
MSTARGEFDRFEASINSRLVILVHEPCYVAGRGMCWAPLHCVAQQLGRQRMHVDAVVWSIPLAVRLQHVAASV